MRSSWLFLFVFLVGCGGKPSSIKFGQTTVSELVQLKGEPLKESEIPVADGKVFHYPENEKFQIERGRVVYALRDPAEKEKSLLYWKHKFKDCPTEEKVLPRSEQHGPEEVQLSCGAQGLSVIYQKGSAFVQRVVEHAQE